MTRYSFRYLFREGLGNIVRHGFMSFATVGVLVACLIIMASFSLVALNINEAIKDIEQQNEIAVFVEETREAKDISQISNDLIALPNVSKVEFVDKETSFKNFKDELSTDSKILEGIENPLRDSFRITIADLDQYETTLTAIQRVNGIAKTVSSGEIAQKLINLRMVMTAIAMTLVIILGGVSVFIVSNTIRLAAYSRREEISIMKMVGATNWFIRLSFMIEGILLGLFGGIVAYFIEWGLYHYLIENALIGNSILEVIPFASIGKYVLACFFAISLIEGIIGSFLSLRRFINV